jgi:predicted membrane channel-forming protein YqfA (hemolysin III family)
MSFGIGILLIRFLEKSNFLSRLVIGGIVIFIYFLGLLIINLVLKTPYISFIIFEQFLFTLISYILLSFFFNKIKNLKTNK